MAASGFTRVRRVQLRTIIAQDRALCLLYVHSHSLKFRAIRSK